MANFRKLPLSEEDKKSRGDLVLQALASSEDNLSDELAQKANQY